MYRFLLRPRWIALHLLVLVTVPAFVRLGMWQLDRFEEERAASTLLQENRALEPVPVAQLVRPGQRVDAGDEWRRVTVRGRYDAERELVVRNRSYRGQIGFYALTPLVTAGGAALVVQRGWVPAGETARTRPDVPAPPDGTVELTGYLRRSEPAADEGPMPAGQVARIALPGLAHRLPYPLYGGYVALTAQRPTTDPAPARVPPEDFSGGWQNLAYAVQWPLFAAIGVAGWGLLVRREALEGRVNASADERKEPGWPAGSKTTP
ncbi:MAG: SURF1 family cytochrome oxidase biogenesis protein [Carbonactinosporaceae bacterium]